MRVVVPNTFFSLFLLIFKPKRSLYTMMSKKILLVLSLLFLAAGVSAASINWDEVDCSQLTYQGQSFAQSTIELPNEVASFLNGETINLEVTSANKAKKIVSGKVSAGILSNISCDARTDATLDAFVTTSVIDKIASDPNPIKAYKEAKANGEIRFVSKSFFTGVKFLITDFFLLFQ